MKTFKYNFYITDEPEEYDLYFLVTSYHDNGNMAIVMIDAEDDEEFGVLTKNLGEVEPGYAFIDTNNNSGAIKMLKKYKFAKDENYYESSGFTSYPLYKFDLEKMKDYIHPDSDYYLIENLKDNTLNNDELDKKGKELSK